MHPKPMPAPRDKERRTATIFQCRFIIHFLVAAMLACLTVTSVQARDLRPASKTAAPAALTHGQTEPTSMTADELGIQFVDGSSSSFIVNRNGKQYLVDLVSRTIRKADTPVLSPAVHREEREPKLSFHANTQLGAKIFVEKCSACHGENGRGLASVGTPDFTDSKVQAGMTRGSIVETIQHGKRGTKMPAWGGKLSDREIASVASFVQSLGSSNPAQQHAASSEARERAKVYTPPDDYLYSLPTGRRLERHGFYANFTHRFVFDPAFTGRARGAVLLGLDGYAVSSFGFRYGVTDKLSVSIYRSPSVMGRPIELMAAYHFLDEHDGHPLNATFRFSVDGQNNFSKNFTTNFEGIFSRTLFKRAQIYVVPTLSLQNRRLVLSPTLENAPPSLPGINSFSLGAGAAFDIRPTVALVGEVIPTIVNGRALGIHRPAYAIAIQKRLWRHAFTLGFSNSPGTIVSQRAGTRATFLGDPSADTPSGLFIGFDLMRQMY